MAEEKSGSSKKEDEEIVCTRPVMGVFVELTTNYRVASIIKLITRMKMMHDATVKIYESDFNTAFSQVK